MTSDFDELASAYLDGQTSDAETAQVESDPALLGEVDELRAIADAIGRDVTPPDDLVKRRQIGVALDAFDDVHGTSAAAFDDAAAHREPSEAAAPIDLSQRRTGTADRVSGREFPSWLGVAAVLVLIVGGIGLLGLLGSGSDDSETASVDVATDAAAGTESTAVASNMTVEASDAAATAVGRGNAANEPAAQDDAARQESAEDSGGGVVEAEEADEGEAGADQEAAELVEESAASATTTAGGGFFPEESLEAARVDFTVIPETDELLALEDGPRFVAELAECTEVVINEFGAEVVFFVPVSVAGVDGEALFVGPDTDRSVLLLDESCAVIG